MAVILNLIGGVALLLWGIRMVRTAVTRGFGADLRRAIASMSRQSVTAFAAGIGTTTLLQSSTATSLLVASFSTRGAITSSVALAILLGADVGTTLVVQIFSHRVEWLSPLLIAIGVVRFLTSDRSPPRNLGRAAIGLGLVLLSLQLISSAAQPLASSDGLKVVLSQLGHEPLLTILLVAGMTVLLHSSVAVVLLLAALSSAGTITLEHAIVMVLGANLGGAFLPVIATYPMPNAARIAPIANAGVRVVGVVIFALFAAPATALLLKMGLGPALAIAQFHTIFNLAIALLALPFVRQIVSLTSRVYKDPLPDATQTYQSNLEEQAFDSPAVAIACATREALRVGDVIKAMLQGTITALRENDVARRKAVEALDDEVDRLYEAIKLYLARLTREELDSEESERIIEILSFTTNLEHVGDIIDKNIMDLAAKKARLKITFSDAGMSEIEALHANVLANMELALNVFISGDLPLARRLLAQKTEIRDKERASAERHFARVGSGQAQSIDSSSIHIDILRDLKRINSHLAAVAYSILERAGELADTRLRPSVTASDMSANRDAATSADQSAFGEDKSDQGHIR